MAQNVKFLLYFYLSFHNRGLYMTISVAEWTCPECKTKNRETCNAWMYGSPIRQCKACRSEYLDRRFREVAIDGFDPRNNNPKFYMKGALFLFLLALVAGGLAFYQHTNGYYSVKVLAVAGASALGSLACLVMLARIKMGFQSKDNEKYMAESKARLADPAYVEKLRKYGYKV